MLGNLLDEYIEGNFYVGNNEKIPPEKLELAPLIAHSRNQTLPK